MRWFEHHTDDRDQAHAKIIRARFGAEGYGIYMSLLEVIGQNVLEDNQEDWGQVAAIHDIQSLAKECAVTAAKLRRFLEFCNEKNIFSKKSGKLFTDLITRRLDIYAKRIKKKSKMFEVASKSVRSEVEVASTLHTHKQIQKQTLDKSNGESPKDIKVSAPQEDKRNSLVDHVLQEFKSAYGFYPTDKKPRYVAQNVLQRMRTTIRERLTGDVTDERVKTGISKFFQWLQRNESFEGIQKLETAKLKMNIWAASLKGNHATNERKDDQGASKQTREQNDGLESGKVLRSDRSGNETENTVLREQVRKASDLGAGRTFESMGELLQNRSRGKVFTETKPLRPDGMGDVGLGKQLSSNPSGIEPTEDSGRRYVRGEI